VRAAGRIADLGAVRIAPGLVDKRPLEHQDGQIGENIQRSGELTLIRFVRKNRSVDD
jgi:hypothetical protein